MILFLTFLYYELVSTLTHDINNNNTLSKVLHLFEKTSNVHSYNTRSPSSGQFYVNSSRLEIQKHSFSRLGVKLWNVITLITKKEPSEDDPVTKAYALDCLKVSVSHY